MQVSSFSSHLNSSSSLVFGEQSLEEVDFALSYSQWLSKSLTIFVIEGWREQSCSQEKHCSSCCERRRIYLHSMYLILLELRLLMKKSISYQHLKRNRSDLWARWLKLSRVKIRVLSERHLTSYLDPQVLIETLNIMKKNSLSNVKEHLK